MVLRKEQKDHAALTSSNTSICVSDWQPPPAKLLKSAALFQIFCNPNKMSWDDAFQQDFKTVGLSVGSVASCTTIDAPSCHSNSKEALATTVCKRKAVFIRTAGLCQKHLQVLSCHSYVRAEAATQAGYVPFDSFCHLSRQHNIRNLYTCVLSRVMLLSWTAQ